VASSSDEDRFTARVGTTINGKYRLDALLGAGGMGAVFSATHRNGARAALKLLHPELSNNVDIRKRFQREAYVANQIEHSGIVRVLDDDVDADGCAYLVMDLLVGQTLEARRLAAGGRLPIQEVISIAVRTLDTLAAAHARGIVHRDVKPENIFLTANGGLKVMDFGIARALDGSGGTRTGALLGTPSFMPPEQAGARHREIDARSDVWATGAVMFVLLTGEDVHPARTVQRQLIAAATQRARPVGSRAPVPDALARVVDKALAFERDDRWPTAAVM
jgi:serine/threonine-protein kinase